MEAKLIWYDTEKITNAVGQITVTATKEEWRQVINDIIEADPENASPPTHALFRILDQMGLV